ncbi:MAG: hypothetical protein ACD_42C00618G0002 [uncultured bacterium]|nr:MAG: hypothetical protein ACD_42C00618G0002 [uncultured bacterium]OGT25590.1 MAG: 5-formyltetrahydrofolate cyclo-ligase [Gammaproteobacteria bacterium RIFCSPHIGHO2_02_FULL_42_43]OGT28969.1 MAG: 5-formyltetrahydrofolate cyclo-ligase [Gammaproteobacteria bacterium RIFCSPHIGHO2_01_FULL_42_8]OGT51544.1 MAG: 5-formyltetrahydrofolate cyclo-ligase [Gammaproteobacteria bacterium RIFCSPHIGHO2_12_FULL_41_25]OGT62243.1 MAG: 5-formyltetrahydrofolate cyclo-ligase [Gammaproteobacteria bacterium RIFCSPLOWO
MKSLHRLLIRKRRAALPVGEYRALSRAVFSKIITLPVFTKAQHVAVYMPHENEVDTQFLIEQAHADKKSVYLPVFSKTLSFHLVKPGDALIESETGILEPVKNSESAALATRIDLMFLPLVAFDERGYRLGRGAGAYDRYLALHRPYLIGLAYEFQKISSLEKEPWDVPMDCVVTEMNVYCFKPRFGS